VVKKEGERLLPKNPNALTTERKPAMTVNRHVYVERALRH